MKTSHAMTTYPGESDFGASPTRPFLISLAILHRLQLTNDLSCKITLSLCLFRSASILEFPPPPSVSMISHAVPSLFVHAPLPKAPLEQ